MGSLHSEIVEDFSEEEYASLAKRPRSVVSSRNEQLSSGNNAIPVPPSQYNPLDEPSPLGLKLKKSPSLLDLIQMRISQGSGVSNPESYSELTDLGCKIGVNMNTALSANDKLKASNFPASLLRIGSWEYISRYEGDLVAKCYFAKHKLVWEVLEGGLKSKLEIQWSDIIALKADLPDNSPGTLTVVLARPPVFFRETNPQPRKHTLWQSSPDFTNGQASKNKQHYVECPPGVLNKHYEKLIQCDTRLNILSRQAKIIMDSPFFELKTPARENSEESKDDGSNQLPDSTKESSISVSQDTASSTATLSSSFMIGQTVSKEATSPISVMDTQATEGSSRTNSMYASAEQKSRDLSTVPGLRLSMSMSDLVNHIGNCISEQMTTGSLPSDKASELQGMLEDVSEVLLTDNTPNATGLDEKSLMKRVNSLYRLLQDPTIASGAQVGENPNEIYSDRGKRVCFDLVNGSADEKASEGNFKDGPDCSEAPSMPRSDSLGDLLLHLPRIASLPKFPKLLFGIAEDDEYHFTL